MRAKVTRQAWGRVGLWMAVAVGSFHAAFLLPVAGAGILMVGFLYGLAKLAEADRPRLAFYPALLVGILCYGPHLWFFTGIFGFVAVSLWTILSLPLGAFVLLVRALRRVPRVPRWLWAAMVPVFWTGIEYYRCEWLYYLKFTWMTPGMAFGGRGLVQILGVYGVTFVMMAWVAYMAWLPGMSWRQRVRTAAWRSGVAIGVVLVGLAFGLPICLKPPLGASRFLGPKGPRLTVVGIQMEEPTEKEILSGLDQAVSEHPNVDLLVMNEYALAGPPTEAIRQWCNVHGRYLLIGGIDKVMVGGQKKEANTAFVIGPEGQIVFRQIKSVPIQFMHDGIPAPERQVWDSPWGKIGICICYDLSYTRVVDDLVRQGAQILIVPAMDPERWGPYQHGLDAQVARVRAAEYHMPVVRVASSGISQVVDASGIETARTAVGAFGATVTAQMHFEANGAGRVPVDRIPAALCMVFTGAAAIWVVGRGIQRKAVKTKARTDAVVVIG